MRILAVDTSTPTGGVALLKDDAVVAEVQVTSTKTHARRLMSAIDSLFRMAGANLAECDGFAVTTGPGSFTGLRIGISTVKGLAFGTGKPVTGVSTLDALAYQFPWFPHLICPMVDARKEEIYTATYICDGGDQWHKVASDCAVNPRPWLFRIDEPCLFVGSGAVMYRELIERTVGPRARFVPTYLNTPRASVVACIGMKQIHQGEITDVASLAPYYIRKSDAEIKLEGHRN